MSGAALTVEDAGRLQECLRAGGVAVFPTDTVYGVGCDPRRADAVRRLYELKGRGPQRPSAVMFFKRWRALRALPELAPAEHAAMQALLPGPVTLLLANPRHRFALACAADPDTLGIRVPALPLRLAALAAVAGPLVQSSANLSGRGDARTLDRVPDRLLAGVDLVLDGGELAGVASTVVDLRDYARGGAWRVVRQGALEEPALARALVSATSA